MLVNYSDCVHFEEHLLSTVPGLWPSVFGHGPQQLPHARLTPALYAALPVLEELRHPHGSV